MGLLSKNKPTIRKNQRDSKVTEIYRFRDFLAPRYWTTWLAIAGLYLMAWLPIGFRICLSRIIGRLLFHFVKSRRHVVLTNIRLCFPELSSAEQVALSKRVFFSNVLTFFETAHAWCRPATSMHFELKGLEHLEEATKQGKGALLLSGHFGPIDIGGALMGPQVEFISVYRKHDNALFNYFMTRARERFSPIQLARKDMKGMLRQLRNGGRIWYAPDQDYGRNASVFVPFFGIQTATITMTSKLAKMGDAAVVPLYGYRTDDCRGFVLVFEPALAIPSDDDVADAQRINQWVEEKIREHPEQYLWLHKRFKTRPEGEPSIYG